MTDADVVPFRAVTEDEAIAWLVANAPVTSSNAELARQFGWNDGSRQSSHSDEEGDEA